MIAWLFLAFLVVAIVFLVVRPYIICNQIYNRYKSDSKLLFFPLQGYIKKLSESLEQYGDSVEFFVRERAPGQKFLVTNIAAMPYVIFYDPNLAKQYLLRHGEFDKEARFLYGEHFYTKSMVSQVGEQWKRQKKILSHAMNFQFLESVTPTVVKVTNQMLDEVESGKPMPVLKSCFKVTSTTVGYSFMSRDMNQYIISGKKLPQAMVDAVNYALQVSFTLGFVVRKMLLPFIPTTKWGPFLTKAERSALHDLQQGKKIVRNLLHERIEKIKNKQPIENDFMGYYLEQYLSEQNQQTKKIVLEEILQQFDSLLMAGSDTTSALAGVCLYCLAKYPTWYSKILEIAKSLPDSPSLKQINSHPELTYFIKEVSRFYPPANDIFPRFCSQPIKIGEYQFPKGTNFGVGIKTVMNDPEVFPNPQHFDPMRWTSPKITNWSYLTFSGGPRSCVGEQLAMLEIKVILLQFVKRFTVKENPEAPLRMLMKVLNTCVDQNLIIPEMK